MILKNGDEIMVKRFSCCNIKCCSSGFTLIELLIVVAIIAILAAIAVPNFLEAQVRSKISRAQSDMRAIQTAIESYKIDNQKYVWVKNYFPEPYGMPEGFYKGDTKSAFGLTSPVSYISSVPEDAFGGSRDSRDQYLNYAPDDYYFATKSYFVGNSFPWRVSPTGPVGTPGPLAEWVLQSKGPDKVWSKAASDGGSGTWELDEPYPFRYDPTNGTISNGNIVRSGP